MARSSLSEDYGNRVERRSPNPASKRRAGHAGGSERAHVLSLPPGVIRRDDWLRQRPVSHRVVPLCLCRADDKAQGQVVLSQVLFGVAQEEQVMVLDCCTRGSSFIRCRDERLLYTKDKLFQQWRLTAGKL